MENGSKKLFVVGLVDIIEIPSVCRLRATFGSLVRLKLKLPSPRLESVRSKSGNGLTVMASIVVDERRLSTSSISARAWFESWYVGGPVPVMMAGNPRPGGGGGVLLDGKLSVAVEAGESGGRDSCRISCIRALAGTGDRGELCSSSAETTGDFFFGDTLTSRVGVVTFSTDFCFRL